MASTTRSISRLERGKALAGKIGKPVFSVVTATTGTPAAVFALARPMA
jgi:hypothetical protein